MRFWTYDASNWTVLVEVDDTIGVDSHLLFNTAFALSILYPLIISNVDNIIRIMAGASRKSKKEKARNKKNAHDLVGPKKVIYVL